MRNNKIPLGDFISEVRQRKGAAKKTIYSVTNDRGFISALDTFGKQVFSEDTSNYKVVGYKDLAFNPSRINVGSVALCFDENGGAVSPMYTIVRCGERLLPEYLLYFLRSPVGLAEINHRTEGAVRFQLKFADLQRIPVYLPAVAEQERIVRLLDEADELRRLRRQADSRTAQLIPAIFNEMFGDPSTNPKGWKVKRLKELGNIVTGNTPPTDIKQYYGNEIEWIKSDNINTPAHFLTQAKVGLSADGKRVGRVVPALSILVTCIAGSPSAIGNAALTNREVAFNQQINAVVPNETTNSYFLYTLITVLKKVIQVESTGGMKGIVSKGKFETVPVIEPPIELQNKFGERFTSVLEMIEQQTGSCRRLDDLFQSLLHRAFQGEL